MGVMGIWTLPRDGKTLVRFTGTLLATRKRLTWRGWLHQRLYRTQAGRYIYQEELPLVRSSQVWIKERTEARTMVNPRTVQLLVDASKNDTDLEFVVYEEQP